MRAEGDSFKLDGIRSLWGGVRSGMAAFLLGTVAVAIVACSPSRGGWDLAPLMNEYPSIEALDGHRLGDMQPFPAFEGDRLALVACRFRSDVAIRVGGDGPGWPEEWARLAFSAMNEGVSGFTLDFVTTGRGRTSGNALDIHITSNDLANSVGPRGLGDTLSECDISRDGAETEEIRGLLVRSEIRIRRVRLDMIGEAVEASADEWIGALMHEVAHALGFAGHTAAGDSILVREQSHLRAAGRRALTGEAWPDSTLEALYQLRPGQHLGSRPLSAESISTLREIRALVQRDALQNSRSVETRSSVGDSQARVQWRLSDGRRLGVRFRHWRDELRSGGEMTLVADVATLLQLAAHPEESRLLVDRRLERTRARDQIIRFVGLAEGAHDDTESE